jgi:hypothetical protein
MLQKFYVPLALPLLAEPEACRLLTVTLSYIDREASRLIRW